MYDCTATIWRHNVPSEFHLFPLPNFGDPNFNRTIRSYTAFRKRENYGLYNSQKKARDTQTKWIPAAIRTSLKDKDEWDVDHRLLNQSLAKYKLKTKAEPQWIRHDSIWDFYKAVGYDYKKKRYVPTNDCEGKLVKSSQVEFQKACLSFKSSAIQLVRQFRADWQRDAGHPEKIQSCASMLRAFSFDDARRQG